MKCCTYYLSQEFSSVILPTHVCINGVGVDMVKSFNFLGVNITSNLTWFNHILAVAKKIFHNLYFLRRLRKFSIPPMTFTNAPWKVSHQDASKLGMATTLYKSTRKSSSECSPIHHENRPPPHRHFMLPQQCSPYNQGLFTQVILSLPLPLD